MTEKIKKELSNEKAVVECAERFGLVGDPTKMKICWLLCHHKEMSVGEVAEVLNVSQSVVSHALKKLKESRMVNARREHKRIFYKLSDDAFTRHIKNIIKQI